MRIRLVPLMVVAALLIAACGNQGGAGPSASGGATASGGKIGGTVSVLATWGGDEQQAFLDMVKPFEDKTGVKVQYEGTRDLNAVLTTRVQGGNPPDVAGLPGPGQMAEFAKQGKLISLDNVLDMNRMKAEYADAWVKLGTVDGKLVGIFIKTSLKGLVWYDPKNFDAKGYTVPKTWDEMMTLSNKIKGDGTAPWCIGLESGAASGWPGTDWIENIFVRRNGAEKYKSWYDGKTKWTSPEVKKAWETWGQIVATQGMVYGGSQTMLTTNFGDSGNPMFASPPKCYLHQQASFITDFFNKGTPGIKAGTDYKFFGFPDIDQQYKGAVEAGGDLFGMFKDTPQARALMDYLTTAEAQAVWVKHGGALSPNKKVDLKDYPDDISRQSAQILTSANTVVFDASDQMPQAMNDAFWKAVLSYVQDPSKLDSILKSLDDTQASAYK